MIYNSVLSENELENIYNYFILNSQDVPKYTSYIEDPISQFDNNYNNNDTSNDDVQDDQDDQDVQKSSSKKSSVAQNKNIHMIGIFLIIVIAAFLIKKNK